MFEEFFELGQRILRNGSFFVNKLPKNCLNTVSTQKRLTFVNKSLNLAIRFLHIILAVSVFFSTTGLVVFQHYCQKELKNLATVHEEKLKEGSLSEEASCNLFSEKCCCAIAKENNQKNCCDTKTAYFDSAIDLQALPNNRVALEIPDLSTTIPPYSIPEFVTIKLQKTPFQHYQPPLLVCDLPVWVQSFLC